MVRVVAKMAQPALLALKSTDAVVKTKEEEEKQ